MNENVEITPDNAVHRVRRFRENLMTPFTKAIRTWEMLQPGDRVAVCISGGKDSMLMAKLFQELQRCRKDPFELVFLIMDPAPMLPLIAVCRPAFWRILLIFALLV